MVWKKRIGGKYAASPIYADGRIYFFNQDGETTVIKPGRKFEALATNTLDDGFMASPAVDGRCALPPHRSRISTGSKNSTRSRVSPKCSRARSVSVFERTVRPEARRAPMY